MDFSLKFKFFAFVGLLSSYERIYFRKCPSILIRFQSNFINSEKKNLLNLLIRYIYMDLLYDLFGSYYRNGFSLDQFSAF